MLPPVQQQHCRRQKSLLAIVSNYGPMVVDIMAIMVVVSASDMDTKVRKIQSALLQYSLPTVPIALIADAMRQNSIPIPILRPNNPPPSLV